ncbi:MAG TPA: ABC transporter permease [Vicinamibacterales bacterium]|nr:ABC transporter permease [Vicinamibacterales bacterium]
MSAGPRRSGSRADRLFRALLRAFPFDFRTDHARDMEQTFRAQRRDARDEGNTMTLIRLWLDTIRDIVTTAPREHVAILRQDVGYALRALRRAPVFTASAVLTLAFGMCAMTGMFTIVNAVMFRPLSVDHPEQLISISNGTGSPFGLSFRDLQDYRGQSTVLADAIGYQARAAVLNAGDGAERITVEMVTDNYFSMLGVQPAAGRLIQPDEGRARGDAPVLVLAYAYWQSRFDGDPSIVSRSVRINGRPFTIIGVASPAFRGTEALVRVAGYVPAWMFDTFRAALGPSSILEDRAVRTFTVLGRLKPGVSLAQARAALDVKAAGLARDYPSTHKDVSLRVVPETHTRPTPEIGPFLRVAATAMAGLAAVLLLITSANVANLLMARAAGRGREVALRAALGARRGRLVRQFLTEAVVLALLATLVAVPIVVLAMRVLHDVIAGVSGIVAIDPDFSVDFRVLAVTLAMAIGAGVVSGLAAALSCCRVDLAERLKSGARGATGLPRRSWGFLHAGAKAGASSRFQNALVVAQVALSLTLLVSGGLFVRSLDRARDVDLGFDPDGLLLASVRLEGYDSAQQLAFYRTVRDRLASLPGVEQAAWIQFPPLGIVGEIAEVSPDDRPSDPDWRPPTVAEAGIGPEYFATARVPLLEGRSFDGRDDSGEPVVIVNETLARQLWPNRSAVGRRLTVDGVVCDVVGVVGNGKYQNVWESPRGAVFRPLGQDVPALATVLVRSRRALPDLAPVVRETIRQVDGDVAIYDVRPMSVHLDNGSAFFIFRLGAFIASMFGGMGVLLASIGLYGMIAYHVSQRTNEIGVRMALGARAADIIRDVLVRGGRTAVIGIAIGVVLAGALARMLRTLLVGVSPFDPLTYAAVAFLLVSICLVASFVPARRATVVDPIIALRGD